MNLTGQTLGNYKLESVIGRGPRATVFRARHLADNRIVAVKVYDESVDPDIARRAAEATQALMDAHVLPIEAHDVSRGLAIVAMRYMPKGSVKARWRRVAPLSDIARILPQIASALDHAHAHGLLHLDLKPSNILLDHPGNAFVTDFGLPASADSPYAAPEVAREGALDARADVYALGAILYELTTGRAPIARRPRDESANQRMADLPAPRSIRSSVPPAVEAVIMRALSIDPDSRYATPGALADAFAEAVEIAASEQTEPAPAGRIPRWGWIGAGLVGILLLAGAIAVSSGAFPSAAAPSPTFAATPTATIAPTALSSATPTIARETTSTPTRTAPRAPPPTAIAPPAVTPSATPTDTPAAAITPSPVTPTPAFQVVSLELKPPANRDSPGERLDLLFDAVVTPSTGGPFGQLFVYLPEIDSLVTTRIGAQVSSGAQVLRIMLIVDCAQLSKPYTTERLFLEIRETDRGPVLYSRTLDYTKMWCR